MLSSLFFLSAMHCFPFVYALLEEISCRKQTRARFLSCFYILHICCWFHAFPYCRYRCILYQIISSAASSHILQKPSEQPYCSLPALPPYIVTPPPFSLWFSSISFLCVWTYAFCRTLPVCYRSSSNKAPLFIRGALAYVSHSFFPTHPDICSTSDCRVSFDCFYPLLPTISFPITTASYAVCKGWSWRHSFFAKPTAFWLDCHCLPFPECCIASISYSQNAPPLW